MKAIVCKIFTFVNMLLTMRTQNLLTEEVGSTIIFEWIGFYSLTENKLMKQVSNISLFVKYVCTTCY